MATATRPRKIRVEEFLGFIFPPDNKYELIDGAIYAMTGGSPAHNRVQANLMRFLGTALRGTGCRPYGSDQALQTMAHTTRYPDVTIYCGDPGRNEPLEGNLLPNPQVVIEVLSPSTRGFDESRKLEEYQSLPSVQTVAFVDPEAEWVKVHQRETNGQWDVIPRRETNDLSLPSLGIIIPKEEVFARD
jgi:Uma2 family endonuclease